MTSVEAFAQLRRGFARHGWDKKATDRIVFELLIHVAIAVAGIAAWSAAWLGYEDMSKFPAKTGKLGAAACKVFKRMSGPFKKS